VHFIQIAKAVKVQQSESKNTAKINNKHSTAFFESAFNLKRRQRRDTIE